jgi:hypothetical protein
VISTNQSDVKVGVGGGADGSVGRGGGGRLGGRGEDGRRRRGGAARAVDAADEVVLVVVHPDLEDAPGDADLAAAVLHRRCSRHPSRSDSTRIRRFCSGLNLLRSRFHADASGAPGTAVPCVGTGAGAAGCQFIAVAGAPVVSASMCGSGAGSGDMGRPSS